jgi:5-formyltetrahydrofolate cyclo-ligase
VNVDLNNDAKAILRDTARQARARIGSSVRKEAAEAAARHFFDAVKIADGQTIAAYWPIRDELDCKPVLTRLMDDGHLVCLPVVMGEDEPLMFRRWELGAPLYPAGFGTLVPPDDAPAVEPDIVLVPLLGFDSTGTRLGYGRAYYDRTVLGYAKRPMLVGYAFAAQELPDIPRSSHDVPLDMIVTELGARRFEMIAS